MYTQLNKKTSWQNDGDCVLKKDEPGYDMKNKILKIGNGKDKWVDLGPAISLSLVDSYNGESTVDGNVEGVDEQSAVIINFLNKKIRELLPGQKALLLTQGETLSDNIEIIANKSYIKPSGTKEVTANGAYDIKEFEKVDVSVKPNLQEKIVTPTSSKQVIKADSDKDGLSAVTVEAVPVEEKTVTVNGEVTPTAGKFLSKVIVKVPTSAPPVLQEKVATENGTYIPDEGYDGLSKVVVQVPPGGEQPQLYAPTATIEGDTLTIEDSESNGAFVTEFDIYVDGVLKHTVTKG